MKLSPIDRRLASRLHTLQIDLLANAEAVAKATDRSIEQSHRRIQATLSAGLGYAQSLHAIQAAAAPLWGQVRGTIEDQLRRMAHHSRRRAVKVLTGTIPRHWWRRVERGLPESVGAGLQEMMMLFPGGRNIAGPVVADVLHEPVLRDNADLTDEEFERLLDEIIFPPLTDIQTRAMIFADTPNPKGGRALNWVERLTQWSKQIAAPSQVAALLAQGLSEGKNIAELTKVLRQQTDLAKSTARRIARTEAMRVANMAQRDSFQSLGPLLQGEMQQATLDQNTRPHHAFYHGAIVYTDGTTSTGSEVPDPPFEPNCRCFRVPVLEPPSEVENDPSVAALFQNAGHDTIPDPAVYDRWFASAPVEARQVAVGKTRYEAMAKRVGGAPDWKDFLDPTGRLVPLDALKRESTAQRAERKQAVDLMIRRREQDVEQLRKVGFLTRR